MATLITWDGVSTALLGVAAGLGIIALLLRGLKSWITAETVSRDEVEQIVEDKLEPIRLQVTPNGGDTEQLGDRVQRIEEKLDRALRKPRATPVKKAVKKRA